MPGCDVIPRIRVSRGRVVAEREDGRMVSRGEAQEAVREALQRWQRAVIEDMDGIRRNRPDLNLLKAFEGEPVWVDAGPRTAESVIDLLVAGAEAVIMRTATLSRMEELLRAQRMTENLLFQLDFDGDLVRPVRGPRGAGAQDLMNEAADLDLRGIVLMDTKGWRLHRDLMREVRSPLYVGLGTEGDARDLGDLGVSGVIVPAEES